MAYKIVAIFVILISWSAVLSGSSIGCGGYPKDVSKNDYGSLIPQIQKRLSRSFSIDDITCCKVASVGHDNNYCVELKIPAGNGRTTVCTVKWGSGSSSGSSSVCSTSGAAVSVNGGSINAEHGNAGLGEAIRNKVHNKLSKKFSKVFGHGFPFNK